MEGSHYHPVSGKIHLEPGATLYASFHELAHKEQHEQNAIVFRAWLACRFLRGLCWLSTIWIEWDAYQRAKRQMTQLGQWTAEARREGLINLKSYFRQREVS